MDNETPAPAGKTAEQILKGKAKVERARLKRAAARVAATKWPTKKQKAKKAKKPSKLAKAARPDKVKKAKKAVKTMAANARTERLDMRLTKAEKAKVHTRASKLRRTVTSIVIEAIEKIK